MAIFLYMKDMVRHMIIRVWVGEASRVRDFTVTVGYRKDVVRHTIRVQVSKAQSGERLHCRRSVTVGCRKDMVRHTIREEKSS